MMNKKDEAVSTERALKLALDYLLSKQTGAHIIAAIREALASEAKEQPAQPRKPLPFNKEDMEGLDVNQRIGFKLGWKSAEAAHGIKENT